MKHLIVIPTILMAISAQNTLAQEYYPWSEPAAIGAEAASKSTDSSTNDQSTEPSVMSRMWNWLVGPTAPKSKIAPADSPKKVFEVKQDISKNADSPSNTAVKPNPTSETVEKPNPFSETLVKPNTVSEALPKPNT